MKEQKKLTSERLMQAKAFLDNGVITEEQFIEMTHGQVEPESTGDSQVLGMIFDKMNKKKYCDKFTTNLPCFL